MATPYTKKALIERIKRHVADGFPNSSFSVSDNEILFLIDDALAFSMKGLAYEGAKIEGALVMPEAFLVTHQLSTLAQDSVTGEWYADLPQPPISLPLGYSISSVYLGDSANGRSDDILPVKSKRVPFRQFMPMSDGIFYRVENNKIKMRTSNGQPLLGQTVFVQMASPRSTDVNAVMNVPEDAVGSIFQSVVTTLLQRYGVPQDVVKDDLPAGNKTS